ncbi:hypothetical protein FRZ61_45830 [Hypericibacter adhaerens]|jgi:hypothetical protein|uniref:ETC complex I subunit n=1 Tax=Hypericibacter adhaerens TaxID=2602016 RepID=A0A5J6N3N4_9PROT|nr:NADH dehydrogenase ubiquinone Fe-S protein 4 [Hypericibacter adhaerens]QEX24642.1 hypothetical protein FRZ61_45830 [Hypericibacter adhaerens]
MQPLRKTDVQMAIGRQARWPFGIGSPARAANRNEQPVKGLRAPVFPADARARIERPSRSVLTAGRAQTKHWRLRFDRRRSPFIEPLMGWTGSDDPLTQIELRFPTLEAAIAYAERQGLAYVVDGWWRSATTGSTAG